MEGTQLLITKINTKRGQEITDCRVPWLTNENGVSNTDAYIIVSYVQMS